MFHKTENSESQRKRAESNQASNFKIENFYLNILNLALLFIIIFSAMIEVSGAQKKTNDLIVSWLGETKKHQRFSSEKSAKELASHMGKVLQRKIPLKLWNEAQSELVFLVTTVETAPEEFRKHLRGKKKDAFIIKYPCEYKGKKVCFLVAQDTHGADFPVCYFLTKYMDFHWVGPGELGEEYKPNPDWKMPAEINVLEEPDFAHRLWRVKTFNNCRKWLAGSDRMRFSHAFKHVFNPSKHADKHPEVYPLLANGKRFIPAPDNHCWQPCVASQTSVDIAAKYVIDKLKKKPYWSCIGLGVNDGAGNICMCEGCRAFDADDAFAPQRRAILTDRFFNYYNRVAKKLRVYKPSAKIGVIQYGGVARPPVKVEKVDPMIQMVCVNPTLSELFGWRPTKAKMGLYFWIYGNGYFVIRNDVKRISELIKLSKSTGGEAFYAETYLHWPAHAHKLYTIAKLLWDTSLDDEKIMEEYFILTYGSEATKHIASYFERWSDIYSRQSIDSQYRPNYTWGQLSQFKHLRRNDFKEMDESLKKTELSKMTKKQNKRLSFLRIFHDWLAANAELCFISRELADSELISSISFDDLFVLISRAQKASARFNIIWKEKIATDKTGWLYPTNVKGSIQDYWNNRNQHLSVLVRNQLNQRWEKALTRKIDKLTDKKERIAFLEKELKSNPSIKRYLVPTLNKLKGIEFPELIQNGNFEVGESGSPLPTINGWSFYQRFGQMKGSKNLYMWANKALNGSKALGLADGDYAELRTVFKIPEKGKYKLSFKYMTENRKGQGRPPRIHLYKSKIPITDIDNMKTIGTCTRFFIKKLTPSDNHWKSDSVIFQVDEPGTFFAQIEGGRQKKGQVLWFDDISLRKQY